MRIEILTEISGVNFASCYKAKRRLPMDDIRINVINQSDLMKNKLASGRPQDLADYEYLKKMNAVLRAGKSRRR